jgi:hypothetical protein
MRYLQENQQVVAVSASAGCPSSANWGMQKTRRWSNPLLLLLLPEELTPKV